MIGCILGVSQALQLKLAPLIGGPSWLPLHVKVVVDSDNSWDFVPLNATSPDTLKSLLLLQSVPGEIRHFQTSASPDENADSSLGAQRAKDFVDSYTNRDLHLIQNNCWTFALLLYWHVFQSDKD